MVEADPACPAAGRTPVRLCAVTIVASKPLWLNILQSILLKPAPVRAFRRGTPKTAIFRE
jgi:hypothetical protein